LLKLYNFKKKRFAEATKSSSPCCFTVGNPTPVLGMITIVEHGEKRNLIIFMINLSTTISMKRSRRELSIDVIIHKGIFNNNQITLFPCFAFIPVTGVSFY